MSLGMDHFSDDRGSASNRTMDQPLVCRICCNPENDVNHLIAPCLCDGLLKYIHEECLKTWLITMQKDLLKARCDVCKFEYAMNYKVETRCSPKYACDRRQCNCVYTPLLIATLFMIGLMGFLLEQQAEKNPDIQEQTSFWITVGIFCLTSTVILFLMARLAVRETCVVSSIVEWNVGNKKKKKSVKRDSLASLKSDNASVADSSMTALSGLQVMSDAGNAEEVPGVLMLPSTLRINGI